MPERFAQKRGLTPYHLDVRDCEQRVRGLSPFLGKALPDPSIETSIPESPYGEPAPSRPHSRSTPQSPQGPIPRAGFAQKRGLTLYQTADEDSEPPRGRGLSPFLGTRSISLRMTDGLFDAPQILLQPQLV